MPKRKNLGFMQKIAYIGPQKHNTNIPKTNKIKKTNVLVNIVPFSPPISPKLTKPSQCANIKIDSINALAVTEPLLAVTRIWRIQTEKNRNDYVNPKHKPAHREYPVGSHLRTTIDCIA
jgi:hypothetical protein